MKLKARIKADEFEKLPDALKEFYVKQADGGYELDAEIEEHSTVKGMKTALEKEKTDRRTAKEARKALMDRLGIEEGDEADTQIEALLALKTQAEKDRGKKMLDEGKVEELLNERVAALKKDHEKQIKLLTGERDSLKSVAERALVDSAIATAANAAGVKKQALQDILLRGKQVFRLEGENVIAMDGDKPKFGKDGQSPLAMGEWLEGLREEAAHLFEPSTGGGANGGARPVAGAFNLTREQARDPNVYRTTKEAAAKAGKEVTIQ